LNSTYDERDVWCCKNEINVVFLLRDLFECFVD